MVRKVPANPESINNNETKAETIEFKQLSIDREWNIARSLIESVNNCTAPIPHRWNKADRKTKVFVRLESLLNLNITSNKSTAGAFSKA